MDGPKIVAEGLCIDFPFAVKRSMEDGMDGPAGSARLIEKGRRSYLRALDHVDLAISPGERVGISGKNGSGKTTLLRTLRGVYPPTEGQLNIDGRVHAFLNMDFGFNEDASGYENILLRGVLMGATPKQMRELTPRIAEFSELSDFMSAPLRSYSAGMRMRLAFAVTTALPGDVILMDEWLSVGDFDFSQKATARLLEIVHGSAILVIASHHRSLLTHLCTKIISLDQGRIVDVEKAPFD